MKIIAIPRNGFGNRMQMLASSHLMAKQLNAELFVHWTEQPVFKASHQVLFDEIPGVKFLDKLELGTSDTMELPRFTNLDRDKKRITLKNLRIGDQSFMPTLRYMLAMNPEASEIWIDSGEKFLLEGKRNFKDSEKFRKSRMEFYDGIKFNGNIIEASSSLMNRLGSEYWAIHIRYNDRRKETIDNRSIIRKVTRSGPITNNLGKKVFIASDDTSRGEDLQNLLEHEGFQVFFDVNKNRNRLNSNEVQEAIVDWLALKKAKSVVSFGGTTFSYEAVVAGDSFKSRVYLNPQIHRRCLNKLSKEVLLFNLYGKLPFAHAFIKGKK